MVSITRVQCCTRTFMTQEENSPESQRRNKRLASLVQGDILVKDGALLEVTEGEIDVYSDGTVVEKQGILHEVSRHALVAAISRGSLVFNYEEELGK